VRHRRRRRLSWAAQLHRVLFIDALFCTRCGGRMKGISLLTDPSVVKRILDYLEIASTPPPLSPARVPAPDPRREFGPEGVESRGGDRNLEAAGWGEDDTRAPP
jgi:hypothetical protein